MALHWKSSRTALLSATAMAGALALMSQPAAAQDARHFEFNIPAQPLSSALRAYGIAADEQLVFANADLGGRTAPPLKGSYTAEEALNTLLAGTNLYVHRRESGVLQISAASDPQSGSAVGAGADQGTVQALIVTAQKREENIQDVPIAMSAFTQEDLTKSQVTGGPDLMTQVPNFTFTKTNFSSYSIQIRGIGTQAISAAVDPAVAVAFNNVPFLRTHFFEQEFFDLERVEVLRGPQGTLYGRNATAGVVNVISAKPKFHFEAKASADVGNYNSTRLEGMLNLPLVEDKAALRIAGAWTKRDGYDTNQITGHPIDGRNLWSTRISLRIDPTENLRTNFIWEHFNENDDRLRSGKQLCRRATAPTEVSGVPVVDNIGNNGVQFSDRYLDQGCLPTSLYSAEAFQVPDGKTLPYYLPFSQLGAPIQGGGFSHFDVYASTTQSHNLRVIESQVDPIYRSQSDTLEYDIDYDIAPALTLSSQTGFNRDFLWSAEDYNRFNTRPGAFAYCTPSYPSDANCPGLLPNSNGQLTPDPSGLAIYNENVPEFGLSPNLIGTPCDLNAADAHICQPAGVFCDPQVGCSDRLVLEDLSEERSRQFTQEFRLASNFTGRFNFSVGANYLRYKTEENYYVFINTITLMTASANISGGGSLPDTPWVPGVSDNHECLPGGFAYVNPTMPSNPQNSTCGYIDPNPITSVNNQGHNYFLSQNPYKLQSYAVFGEAYYNITPELKLTAGLRWTDDKKHFVEIPSEILVAGYGYPVTGAVNQQWREPTGRLVLDWTPQLGFTDKTLVYGSYTHGYKAGGANPPGAVLLTNRGGDIANPIHPLTFNPEFVNAWELGTKNTLLDGRLTVNADSFYYDYTGYQISEIVDRSAINLNFDAKIWGAELETDWRPVENLRFGLKFGYEDTRMAKGDRAVDLMDRTGGRPGWMVVRPFVTQASNCILPTYVVAAILYNHAAGGGSGMDTACGIAYGTDNRIGGVAHEDPATLLPYTPNPTQALSGPVMPGYAGFNLTTAPNNGAGFDKNLSGHSLPNAPHWTATLTADYTLPLPHSWLLTLHGDFYQQAEAWARVFNDPGYDKLKAYNNVNLAAIFSNEETGWTVMAYVKNVFNKDNITGAFLNSDDTGLTTNVFLNEPRLFGLRVTKAWTDSPWWSSYANKSGYYPFRLELEGYHGPDSQDHQLLAPATTAMFPADFRFPFKPQRDLGWGSGGGVKFTYQPEPNGWNASFSVRYGRAVGKTQLNTKHSIPEICLFGGSTCINPDNGKLYINGQFYYQSKVGNKYNYTDSLVQNGEEHAAADFMIGRDVGLGALASRAVASNFAFGLGYARLTSSSSAMLHGTPDLTTNGERVFQYYDATHAHRLSARMNTRREFEGAGPKVEWDAAIPLAGNAEGAGLVALDVGAGGGVIFGKQNTKIRGYEQTQYLGGPAFGIGYTLAPGYTTPLTNSRTKSVSVPTANANLGLSYTVGTLKVSGGYRAERYFKAIDGGIDKRKTYDRDINGAYAKVSIGFGG